MVPFLSSKCRKFAYSFVGFLAKGRSYYLAAATPLMTLYELKMEELGVADGP